MFFKAYKPENFINNKDAEKEFIDLAENNGAHLKLVSLKKNVEIDTHMSHADVTMYVIDGEVEISFIHDEGCSCSACMCELTGEDDTKEKEFKVKKGEIFMFPKEVPHYVKAVKDTMFFLVKI